MPGDKLIFVPYSFNFGCLIIKVSIDIENRPNQNLNNNPNKPANPSGDNQGQKKPRSGGRRFYYHHKKYRKPQSEQDTTQRETQNFSFKKTTVLIPLFNEEESLRPLYGEIKKAFKGITGDHEILFVDDGSTDKSLQVIKDLARLDNKVKYVSFRKNYGKSAALQVGFKHSTGDAVITMDADLQDDPAEIPNLLKKLDEGYDLVSGWKKKRFDPFIKRTTSKFFNYFTKLLTGIKIHDFNCGLKAYRRLVVENVQIYGELHRYIPVLADWKGFAVGETVVKHHPRRYGKTKFGISRFFKGPFDLITVLFTTRYIKRPMHLFGYLGFIATAFGILVNAFLTYEWIMGKPLSNRPLLFLGMLLIIVGVQFFAVGLLGEIMVHNTHDEKEYIIKDKK